MRAVIVDPEAPAGLRIAEVPDPVPAADQVLVEVHYISLNFGDLSGAARQAPGFIPGWDASGIVKKAAGNGKGPAVGTEVCTVDLGQQGWAELRTASLNELAVVPPGVGMNVAAAIPVAGVGSSLRALRYFGSLYAKRVLVTGASGGVGRYAVQLASQAGATVIASVGSLARGAGLHDLGADQVVVGLEGVEAPLDLIVDNVGGPQLSEAFVLLGDGGSAQCIGAASREQTVFARGGGIRAHERSMTAFWAGGEMGEDIGYLLDLVARGQLKVEIGFEASWEDIGKARDALFGRQVAGKAVLAVR